MYPAYDQSLRDLHITVTSGSNDIPLKMTSSP